MENFFEKIELLAEADPLLLYGFIYVCPLRDFNSLIPKILPYLSISFLANLLENLQTLNNDEVNWGQESHVFVRVSSYPLQYKLVHSFDYKLTIA